jgi:hypothetical protein
MRKLVLNILCAAILIPMTTLARGTISSGGDNATAFECKSPANVDANFKVVGFGNAFNRQIELEIYIDGRLVAKDVGVLTESPENYIGQTFDIVLKRTDNTALGQIRAKANNSLFRVGQSAALEACKRSGVH